MPWRKMRFGFVSEYRFSDTASSESNASSRAYKAAPEKTKPTWRVGFGGVYVF